MAMRSCMRSRAVRRLSGLTPMVFASAQHTQDGNNNNGEGCHDSHVDLMPMR